MSNKGLKPKHKMSTKMEFPPELKERFAEWGRKGGKGGTREQKIKAGQISAMKRYANLPKCPTCGRVWRAPRKGKR